MTAPLDRDRLAKLLGMLGSDHDGEVAAAGRHADALVRRAGLTWADVVSDRQPALYDGCSSSAEQISFCLRNRDGLSQWEIQFLLSLHRQSYELTERQRSVLAGIVAKVNRQCAEAA
jgi:hypothetical protein